MNDEKCNGDLFNEKWSDVTCSLTLGERESCLFVRIREASTRLIELRLLHSKICSPPCALEEEEENPSLSQISASSTCFEKLS